MDSLNFQIKLWRLPSSGALPTGGISVPALTLPQQPRRVETVSFNPAADHVSDAQLIVFEIPLAGFH